MSAVIGFLAAGLLGAVLIALVAIPFNRALWRVEQGLSIAAAGLVLLSMLFVSAEVIGRQLFNSPIPGHLELSEMLLPPMIFLALAYTQATGGHVRMTIFVDRLGPRSRMCAEIVAKVLSLGIYGVLCYFSAKHAWGAWEVRDVTMSPPYFVTWPSSVMVPIGLFFVVLRLYLEILHLAFPKWLPAGEPGLDAIGD